MKFSPQSLLRKLPIRRWLDWPIRCTSVVLLTQTVTLGISSCESLSSPTDAGGLISNKTIGIASEILYVNGEVSGNDAGGGAFVTTFSVAVTNDPGVEPREEPRDQPRQFFTNGPRSVSGASVSVWGPFGEIALPEVANNPGVFRASRNGYSPGTYIISVERSASRTHTVTVSAPDIHTITSPVPFDTIRAGKPFTVSWDRPTRAQEVFVETRDVSLGPRPDTGNIRIPASKNPPRENQLIQIWRSNRQTLAGKRVKTHFVARVGSSVEPIIVR